jgi:small multidrug resistance pump
MLDLASVIGLCAMIVFTVAASLVLKMGAAVPAAERVILGIFGWESALGLVLFGVAGLIYAVVLRRVPLNVALAFTAAQYVGVAIAAAVVLSEPIPWLRWIGIALIGLGIFVVGLTSSA